MKGITCLCGFLMVTLITVNTASADQHQNSILDFGGYVGATGDVPDVSVNPGDNSAEEHEPSGYGGWGGPTVGYLFLNAASFDPLADSLGIDINTAGMLMIGGGGGAQLGPYFRIGGGGAGGSIYADGSLMGFDRKTIISIGYGGMILYGTYPLGNKLDLYGRLLLGAGGLNIYIKADEFGEGWDEAQAFLAWVPALGVAYHPVKWMSVELEASYFGMDINDMTWEGQRVVDGGLAGGPMAQINIYFGWVDK